MRGLDSQNFHMGLGELYIAAGRVPVGELIVAENRVGRLLGEVTLNYERVLRRIADETGTYVCDLVAGAPVSISGTLLTDCEEAFELFMPAAVGDTAPLISVGYVGESGVRYVCGTATGDLPLTFGKTTPLGIAFTVTDTGGV